MRAIVLLLILAAPAFAAGLSPGVNVDMGCTSTGQSLTYNGSAIACQAPQRPTTTVGSLPTCNSTSQGQMMFVTDALAPVALSAVAGSGAVKIGVTCNGASWIVQ